MPRSNLAKRVMVGIPLATIVLFLCYKASHTTIVIVTYLVLLLCWREFLQLVMPGRVPRLFHFVGGLILSGLYFTGIYHPDYFMIYLSISVGLMFLLNVRDYLATFKSGEGQADSARIPIVAAPMGLVFVLSLVLYVPKIHFLPDGQHLLGIYLGGVWLCDTGAYFVGKYFGKHPLAPSISPKKTWEGFWGGTAASCIWLIFYRQVFWAQFSILDILLATVLLGPTSQLGDLAESLLKRSVDKKDAGSILPGHGGILDRLDGYLLSCPLYYLYVTLRFAGGVSG